MYTAITSFGEKNKILWDFVRIKRKYDPFCIVFCVCLQRLAGGKVAGGC